MIARKNKKKLYAPSVSVSNFSIAFKKHSIYYVKVHDNKVFSLEFFPVSLKFRNEHPEFDPKLLLFEFGKFSSVDAETREFSSKREDSPFIAEAVVVCNLAQRLLVTHYAKIMNSRGITVRIFNDYLSASTWLNTFVK
jgi:hypothetical protein